MSATVKGTQQWLDTIPLLDIEEVTPQQYDAVVAQISRNSAMETIFGLISAERQAKLVMLAHLPLDTASAAARASVTQGEIKGLERARETVLELVHRAAASTALAGDKN